MVTSANMGLTIWNLDTDLFSHIQLENNWAALDTHNHTTGQGVQIPTGGIADGAITTPKIADGAITTPKIAAGAITDADIAAGTITADKLANALAQSAGVNEAGQVVKGAVNIAASQSTTSATYTTLTTPDQVTGIVLPSNGLIAIGFQGTLSNTGAGNPTIHAALFLGSNQLQQAPSLGGPPALQEVAVVSPSGTYSLATATDGLHISGGGFTSDATTGQILGQSAAGNGGLCWIFAAAGTYTVSVRFRITGGTSQVLSASNRKLWVQAISFS